MGQWLKGGRGVLEPSRELMMGSGFCLAPSPATMRSAAFLWILRVICNTFVDQRGKGSDSVFFFSESHPPHKVAQERGGRRLWQQEDRCREAGCSCGLPAVQGDPPLMNTTQTFLLGASRSNGLPGAMKLGSFGMWPHPRGSSRISS